MNDTPRRGFLKAAGAGAAAAGAVVVTASTASSASAATPLTVPKDASGALVAYITDIHGSGEITVMVEGREVVVNDRDLVARLARAIHARSGNRSI